MDLTQSEADRLLLLDKHRVDASVHRFPSEGGRLNVSLVAPADSAVEFTLDITRSTIALTKGSYQTRAHTTVILARLCVDGPGHTNPDGADVGRTHLHRYREGYGDKWAGPLPQNFAVARSALSAFLDPFLKYCNVTSPPVINMDLFS